MEITITDGKRINEIQEEFQRRFPYLKIEFFKNGTNGKNSGQKSTFIPAQMALGQVRYSHADGLLQIDGARTVEEIENDFRDKFGLAVQVFRKSGNMWIETSLTHHWSLMRQNLEGQQLS